MDEAAPKTDEVGPNGDGVVPAPVPDADDPNPKVEEAELGFAAEAKRDDEEEEEELKGNEKGEVVEEEEEVLREKGEAGLGFAGAKEEEPNANPEDAAAEDPSENGDDVDD